jgi:hypothetical protein
MMMHRKRSVCALELLESRLLFQAAGPSPVPGPSNTGPQGGVALAPSGTITITQAGAVVQDLAINGQIFVDADNVTIEDCTENDGGQSNYYAVQIEAGITNTTIENCSFTDTGNGTYAIVTEWQANNTTIENCQFYGLAGSSIDLNGENATVENNWFYDDGYLAAGVVNNGQTGDFHSDDIFMSNGTLTCLNNNFDTPNAITVNGVNYGMDTILFICPFTSADVIGGLMIENNIISGGGYSLDLFGSGPATIENNIFGPPGYNNGFIYPSYVGDPITWSNNVLQSTGQQLSAPVVNSSDVLTAEPEPTGTITPPPPAEIPPTITANPQSLTVSVGQDASFNGAATGDPTLVYQWMSAPAGSTNFTAISGATSTTLNLGDATAAQNGLQIELVATDDDGTAISSIATLTVNQPAPPPPPPPVTGVCVLESGNGKTAYLSLQLALNAAVGSTGDTILVEQNTAGGYFNGAITNLSIVGDGGEITGVCSDGQDAIDAEPGLANGLTVSGLKFVGDYSRAAIRIEQSTDTTVTGCVLACDCEWGIYSSFASSQVILGNTLNGAYSQHAIYAANSSVGVDIVDNDVTGKSAGSAIQINGDASQGGSGIATDCVVNGNTITYSGPGGAAINLDGVQSSTIENNVITGAHHTGIALFDDDGAAGPVGDLVYDNTITMSSKSERAIEVEDAAGANTVEDNTVLVGTVYLEAGTISSGNKIG